MSGRLDWIYRYDCGCDFSQGENIIFRRDLTEYLEDLVKREAGPSATGRGMILVLGEGSPLYQLAMNQLEKDAAEKRKLPQAGPDLPVGGNII